MLELSVRTVFIPHLLIADLLYVRLLLSDVAEKSLYVAAELDT